MKTPNKIKIGSAILSLIIFSFSLNEGFFWDNTTLGYKMSNFLFSNGMFNFNFTKDFDGATPPLFSFMQATAWHAFGKNLLASHLLQLPFIYGTIIQLYRFVKHYIKSEKYIIPATVLLLLDPTLSAQFVLLGHEIVIVFFFFLALNGILNNNKVTTTIGLVFLSLIHLRGMMLCLGLFTFDLFRHYLIQKRNIFSYLKKKKIIPFIISSILPLLYLSWRYITRGWLITHPDSPWKGLWTIASPSTVMRNIIIIAHRYSDFGRVAILICILYFIAKNTSIIKRQKIIELLSLSILSVIVIIVASLFSNNPFGHRYILVSYLIVALLAFVIIKEYSNYKKPIYIILVIMLITGNFWVYPKRIAQGWDASLAHMPYFNLRTEAIDYLYENNLSINKTATFFPNRGLIDMVDLSGNKNKFIQFTGKETYVFYSNIYNLSDQEYDTLEQKYKLVQRFSSGLVHVDLLKLKSN